MNRSGSLKISFVLLSLSCTAFEPASDRLPDAAVPELEWQCLHAPRSIPPPATFPERITYLVPIVDFDSQRRSPTAVPGLEITVCNGARCDAPLPACAGVLAPDCVGIQQVAADPPFIYTLSFPYGFADAVLRLQAPGYAGVDYLLGGPMVGTADGAPVVNGLVISMPLWATAEKLSRDVGVSPSPDQRTLTLRALDCDGQRAPGVTVQPLDNEQGIPFELSDDTLTRRDTLVTGARGVGGLIGLPSPSIDVVGLSPSGIEFGGPTSIELRAGVITLAELRHGLGVWGQ
jgi:hypothetical protein